MDNYLVGGIGLTYLKVYHVRPGPDGVHASCAHVHALTDEAYYGVAGEGAVELHDLVQGFKTVPINKGTFVQFPPGTVHRSVSYDHLEVVALMGNGGLAERGDARIYFGPEVDQDEEEYTRLKELVSEGEDGALRRRDASCRAYMRLLDLWKTDHDAYRAELLRFVERHRRDIAKVTDVMLAAIERGPVQSVQQVKKRLQDIGNPWRMDDHIRVTETDASVSTLGMCGVLRQIDVSEME